MTSFDPSDPNADSSLDLRALWRTIAKGRWIISGAFCVVLAAVVIWTLRQPKVYAASTSIIIETTTAHVLNIPEVQAGAGMYWANREFYETQFKVIRSREVARRVVEKLALDLDLSFLGIRPSDLEANGGHLPKPSKESAISTLVGRTRVDPVKDSKIANIIVEDSDPERAVKLSTAVADAYIQLNLDAKLGATRDAANWLREQLDGLTNQVASNERELLDFKSKRNILSVSLEDQLSMIASRLKLLNDELGKLQIQRMELGVRRKEIAELRESGDRPVLQNVIKSPLVGDLKKAELKLREQLTDFKERYAEQHPKLQATVSQLNDLRAQLDREIDNELKALDTEYRTVSQNEKAVQSALETEKRAAFELNKLSIDYNRMKREADNTQNMHKIVLGRLKETDLTQLLNNNNVRKLDPALRPAAPVRPRFHVNLLAGGGLGVLLGLALAFLRDYLDNTLKNQEDVEGIVRLPFLGMIPSIKQEAGEPAAVPATGEKTVETSRDLHLLRYPRSTVAECHRAVRTNITFMSPDKPLRRILVSSAGPQEGKSTTAIGVGVTMAQSGGRVVLVDTDMRRPRLHRAFGVSNERGVSTYLVGEAPIDNVLKHTDVPGLDVLPCGPTPPNPAEILHSEKFRELVNQLSERYDRVIFDSPPIIAVTDAAVLSTHMDGVILVVKAGKTSRDLVLQAKKQLADINAHLLGIVLNDLDLSKRQYGYYYYRYYRNYGRYYSYDEKTRNGATGVAG